MVIRRNSSSSKIHRYLAKHPDSTAAEIADALGMDTHGVGASIRHLKVTGRVETSVVLDQKGRAHRYRCVGDTTPVPPKNPDGQTSIAGRIKEYVRNNPGCLVAEASDALDIKYSKVGQILSTLKKRGILRSERLYVDQLHSPCRYFFIGEEMPTTATIEAIHEPEFSLTPTYMTATKQEYEDGSRMIQTEDGRIWIAHPCKAREIHALEVTQPDGTVELIPT